MIYFIYLSDWRHGTLFLLNLKQTRWDASWILKKNIPQSNNTKVKGETQVEKMHEVAAAGLQRFWYGDPFYKLAVDTINL